MQDTAKVFTTGNSQAVRLPKAYRINVSEMWITKMMLRVKSHSSPSLTATIGRRLSTS